MPLDCCTKIDDWCSLQTAWEGGEDVVQSGMPHTQLSPAWQAMILGDGSLTRHLQLITGESIEVDVIDMSKIDMHDDNAPIAIQAIVGPRVRRQVWLRSHSGRQLAYATSWWSESQADYYLRHQSLPLGTSLRSFQAELYRDIKGICYGSCKILEDAWGESGPFWGRYYYLWHERKPLTLIYEVFSPHLQQYIGESSLS